MARFIALYLPQYHPCKENDEWWGPGFTEWVNVAKARPLFKGHKQPHIPADLGFYDLRLPETREEQVRLAREAGIEGFCYYHYWFGNGFQLLERPFKEVVESGKPDFPFCLCWANHSWYKKTWDPKSKGNNILLAEQKYLGQEDWYNHFISLLPAFKDNRYIRVNGKLLFLIYDALNFKDVSLFISYWRQLAFNNQLGDFFFVAEDGDSRNKDNYLSKGFDAIYNCDFLNIHHNLSKLKKAILYFGRRYLNIPTLFKYKEAIKYMITEDCKDRKVFPTIAPNWDHSPRSGKHAMILTGSTPELFEQLANKAIITVKNKPEEEQIIMIKSWNEWGEGNYMEPDQEFGHGYLRALRSAIDSNK